MGRASRGKAHRQLALGADNRGNRWRKIIACNECLALLANDLRVQEQFAVWVRTRDAGPPAWVHSQEDFDRAWAETQQQRLEQLSAVLRQMGVPWAWCPHVLLTVSFPTMLHNAEHPDDLHAVHGTYELRDAPEGGKTPRHRGEDVAEWVRWWYRRKIKHPPDEFHALVDEYATRANRVTEAHSVVQNGIERAELLLNVSIRPEG
jgi:hypothetical protein